MPAPLLLDLTHTSHTHARTGIQRVARSLFAALSPHALPVTHDPYQQTWRPLQPWELANLRTDSTAKKRSAQWPLLARLRGRLRRNTAPSLKSQISNLKSPAAASVPHALVVPEIFSPTVAAALPALLGAATGPRVALFHDAIALKFPELTPPKTVARFPAYLAELLAFDAIAAVSEDSAATLADYWHWLGAKNPPPIRTLPLGIDTHPTTPIGENNPPSALPTVLSVGSIEGRKNHLALLDACESLWARGEKFSLHLIGLAQPQTGAAALARLQQLQAAGRPLRYDGPVTDRALASAYAHCTFTVYPSLLEGFGLPVLESLAHGRPCICSSRGALGESARGGGCLALDRVDSPSLSTAISQLLRAPSELAALVRAARARRFRTWPDYARDLLAWLPEIARR